MAQKPRKTSGISGIGCPRRWILTCACWGCNKPVSDECFFPHFAVPIHTLLCTEHNTHKHAHTHTMSLSHTSHSWLHQMLQFLYCGSDVLVTSTLDSCLSSHLTGWFMVSLCVCVCVPGELPSPVLFLAWCSWWVLWRPCSCAYVCAWRTGEGRGSACSAPLTSTLWHRAIQVGKRNTPIQDEPKELFLHSIS